MNHSLGDFNTMHGESTPQGFTYEIGSRIGDYLLLENIDKGGMGEVYRVQQVNLGTEFALKVLLPHAAQNPTVASRFEVEARVMAALNHPNIVKVNYFGNHHGTPYMVMDLIQSNEAHVPSLEGLIKRQGKIPEEQVLKFTHQMCSALDYMHTYKNQGIIHRDIKPANILFNQNNDLLITDFGLVKVNIDELKCQFTELNTNINQNLSIGDMNTMDSDTAQHELTMQGAVLGTYDYMAPEIMEGREASAQSDIYALGIIIYKMLTGQVPRGRFKPVSSFGCSPSWNPIIEQCLENVPNDRPASITNLLQRLPTQREPAPSAQLQSMGNNLISNAQPTLSASTKKPALKLAKTTKPTHQASQNPPIPALGRNVNSSPQAESPTAFKVQAPTHSEAKEDYKYLDFFDTLHKALAGIWFIPVLGSTLLLVFGLMRISVDEHELSDFKGASIITLVISLLLAWSHQERKSFARIPCILIYLGLLTFSIHRSMNVDSQWLYLTTVSVIGLTSLFFGKRLLASTTYSF